MKKATNHRKRHVPPGPCGIWFQTHQQLTKQQQQQQQQQPRHGSGGSGSAAADTSNNRRSHGSTSTNRQGLDSSAGHGGNVTTSTPQGTQPSDDGGTNSSSGALSSPSSSRSGVMEDMSFSPAWTCMQQDLQLITPYLPPTLTAPADRYAQLRPHMPSEYRLLWELRRGDYDFGWTTTTNQMPQTHQPRYLVVLVTTVESHIHHNIWTVELRDETGASVQAWIEPTLVQAQLQHSLTDQSIIRPGVVWKLDQVGMILVPPSSTDDQERLERMLLIRGSAISQVWTPEPSRNTTAAEGATQDTPRRQRAFLEWMERRKALRVMEDDEAAEVEEVPPEEMDVEDHSTHEHRPTANLALPADDDKKEDDEEALFDQPDRRASIARYNHHHHPGDPSFLRRGGIQHETTAEDSDMTQSQASSRFATQESSGVRATAPHGAIWSRLRLGEIPPSPQQEQQQQQRQQQQQERHYQSQSQSQSQSQRDSTQPKSTCRGEQGPPPAGSRAGSSRQPQQPPPRIATQPPPEEASQPSPVDEKHQSEASASESAALSQPPSSQLGAAPSSSLWNVDAAGGDSSSLWNMLDEADDQDEDEEATTFKGKTKTVTSSTTSKASHSLERDEEPPKELPPNKPAPAAEPAKQDMNNEDDDSDVDIFATTTSGPSSIFDASNFGTADFGAAFDDDDDDDDD